MGFIVLRGPKKSDKCIQMLRLAGEISCLTSKGAVFKDVRNVVWPNVVKMKL